MSESASTFSASAERDAPNWESTITPPQHGLSTCTAVDTVPTTSNAAKLPVGKATFMTHVGLPGPPLSFADAIRFHDTPPRAAQMQSTMRRALVLLAQISGCKRTASTIEALTSEELDRFDAQPLLGRVESGLHNMAAMPTVGSEAAVQLPAGGLPTAKVVATVSGLPIDDRSTPSERGVTSALLSMAGQAPRSTPARASTTSTTECRACLGKHRPHTCGKRTRTTRVVVLTKEVGSAPAASAAQAQMPQTEEAIKGSANSGVTAPPVSRHQPELSEAPRPMGAHEGARMDAQVGAHAEASKTATPPVSHQLEHISEAPQPMVTLMPAPKQASAPAVSHQLQQSSKAPTPMVPCTEVPEQTPPLPASRKSQQHSTESCSAASIHVEDID